MTANQLDDHRRVEGRPMATPPWIVLDELWPDFRSWEAHEVPRKWLQAGETCVSSATGLSTTANLDRRLGDSQGGTMWYCI